MRRAGGRTARTLLRTALAVALLAPAAARAQAIDMSHGGPITVTAAGGMDWDQTAQTVTAYGDARAVRGDVTVTADRLIAFYRKKQPAPGAPAQPGAPGAPGGGQAVGATTPVASGGPSPPTLPAGAPGATAPGDTGNNEIYRLQAIGHVHIFTATDQAFGDKAIYDIDQSVLVLTGQHLRITTPQDVMTARNSMEYWSQRHVAVGRGDAVVTTADGRQLRGDVLVAYTDPAQTQAGAQPAGAPAAGKQAADPLAASAGKLREVQAFGHVVIRTATETIEGARGVYVPATGIARLVGGVHIVRGQNVLNGAAAIVNMRTGISTLSNAPGGRVEGLVVPQEQDGAGAAAARPARKAPAR